MIDIVDRPDYDPNTPYYQILPPGWAFGTRVSFKSATFPAGIFELFAEKLLHYQKLGVFSVGVHLATAPLGWSRYENLKYGALIRYQLHFMKNQIIVPTLAFVYDSFRLKDNNNAFQTSSSSGIMFGGMLNLGFFDSETARQGHESMGLLRSYLTLELRPSVSIFPGQQIALSGNIIYAGIRLEVE